jgi:hypothetical protein
VVSVCQSSEQLPSGDSLRLMSCILVDFVPGYPTLEHLRCSSSLKRKAQGPHTARWGGSGRQPTSRELHPTLHSDGPFFFHLSGALSFSLM